MRTRYLAPRVAPGRPDRVTQSIISRRLGRQARRLVDLNRVSISLGDSGDWEEFDKVQDQIKGQKLFL